MLFIFDQETMRLQISGYLCIVNYCGQSSQENRAQIVYFYLRKIPKSYLIQLAFKTYLVAF